MKSSITIFSTALLLGFAAQANLKEIQKEMDLFQKPMVKQLQSVLQNDPSLTNEYKTYLAELKDLESVKDVEQRAKLAVRVNLKHKSLFQNAMKKANVDSTKSQKKADELSKKYSSKNAKYLVRAGEFLTYAAWLESQSQESPPVETEVEFRPPFDFNHSSRQGNGSADTNLETGRMYASAYAAFLGLHQNRAGVGMFLRLPWNNRLVRVSARLPETYFSVTAFAALGGSGAKSSSIIDVIGEDGEVCKKEIDHAIAIAPVVWYSSFSGEDTTVFACEAQSPAGNQDISIRFQAKSELTAAGGTLSFAITSATPDPIRVRLIQ